MHHTLRALPFPRVASPKVVYVVALCVSCMGSAVNMLSTIAALKARHIFIPDEKWSPLSLLTLTHDVSYSVAELSRTALGSTKGLVAGKQPPLL